VIARFDHTASVRANVERVLGQFLDGLAGTQREDRPGSLDGRRRRTIVAAAKLPRLVTELDAHL
jgi:hypothetical protein